MNFIAIAQAGFEAWAAKPHNAKWFRKIDGTPIPNDLPVCIAQAFSDALASRSAPEAGKAVVKPLDLSNLLRHAFMFGFETMGGGTAEAAKDWWPVYNPEECPAFERILSALASSSAPTGAEPTGEIAGLIARLKRHYPGEEPMPLMTEAAAALTASEAEATSLRRKLDEHRRVLAEARERINRYADTAAEHDLVARIDALSGASE